MNTHTRQNTRPLIVAQTRTECAAGHEITITTDGHRAYASGSTTDADNPVRELTRISVNCNEPVGDPTIACRETAHINIDDHNVWTGRPSAVDLVIHLGLTVVS